MGIFGRLLKREDPLVTTPPLTIVATKKKAAPTKVATRPKTVAAKPPAKKPAKPTRKQLERRGYLCFYKTVETRGGGTTKLYFWAKEAKTGEGWRKVYEVPEDRVVKYTKNGMPVLAKKGGKPAPKKTAAAKASVKKAPAKKPAAKKRPAYKSDYKGDVHEVVDLEGIGPTYAKKLQGNGIHHTQHILFATDARLQKVTGAPAKTVQNWKHMSQLVKVSGIGPQFAELMVRAGLGGIEELKTLDVKKAVKQINDYRKGLGTKVQGSGIGEKRLKDWQAQAKQMRKVPIDLKKVEPIALESRAAKAAANSK